MRRVALACFICFFIIIVTACGNQGDSTAPQNNPPQNNAPENNKNLVEADQETMTIFEQNCITCHAADLSGRVGEQSNLQDVGARLSKEQIIDTIKNGGQIMPAQTQLSDEEIEKLANWLSTIK